MYHTGTVTTIKYTDQEAQTGNASRAVATCLCVRVLFSFVIVDQRLPIDALPHRTTFADNSKIMTSN